MNGRKWGFVLGGIVLVGVAIFTSVHYFTLLDQNRILQRLVRSYERKLTDLEQAKKAMEDQLTAQKNVLDLQLKETMEQLKLVTEELTGAKGKIVNLEKTNYDLLAMQQELKDRVGLIAQEKEALEAKLNSLDELKKAIRDLKIKMRQERLAAHKQREEKQIVEGNRGFLIYQGVSTIKGKVKIEVTPVP
ncbi:MAG: hypothetical protein Q8N14_06010 [Candidatus Omnitrophota bacterium]|nr:hypothetical protein [Candidatus Omnitrophota bacterium]